MDALTLKWHALRLLAKARREADPTQSSKMSYQVDVLLAIAEHLERTGHYIEVPAYSIDMDGWAP